MTQALCIHVPALRDPLEITLPGGIALKHIELADLIQPALAPLVPIFNIVDCIAALYACSKAVVDALGPPPDPSKLAACVPELAEKVSKLLGMVPALSIPLLVLGLIDLLIAVLSDVRAQLIHLQVELEQMARIIERARELSFGFAVRDAQGNPRPEVAYSDAFNVIRDTQGVRKVGDHSADLLLNGLPADVKLRIEQFPVLGNVEIVDGESGLTL